jgi:hypothetical protein
MGTTVIIMTLLNCRNQAIALTMRSVVRIPVSGAAIELLERFGLNSTVEKKTDH